MRVKSGFIGEPERWLHLFEDSFDEKKSYHKTRKASAMKNFAIRLAKANSIEIFDKGFWDKGELKPANFTNLWKAAYALMGLT